MGDRLGILGAVNLLPFGPETLSTCISCYHRIDGFFLCPVVRSRPAGRAGAAGPAVSACVYHGIMVKMPVFTVFPGAVPAQGLRNKFQTCPHSILGVSAYENNSEYSSIR